MILEAVVLNVRDGEALEFEAAFDGAKAIIAASPGFGGLRLLRCLETTGRYLLLVEWASLEDHVVGFRESEPYQEWRRLLHHFYEPAPLVEHYEPMVEVGPNP
jgi:heme-degrading monooxygenase HmoA